jgi:hypothetical protein
MMVKCKDSFSRGISKCTQSVQSIAIINGVSTLIEKAQYTGICTEEDIRSVISDAFGETFVEHYYDPEKITLNSRPINQQRALWLNKEWAIQRMLELEMEKMLSVEEKQEKQITRQISKAVSKRLDDPDKQPVTRPYKKEEHDGYVFCCANACTKVRQVVAAGVDEAVVS